MGTVYHFPYRTVAEIRLRALLRNLHTLRGLCQKEIIPVVKANAYGHGLIPVARALALRGSCSMVAVATLEEAIQVREAVPRGLSILVLSGFFPHQVDAYSKYRLTPLIHSLTHLKALERGKELPELHLEVDSGIHRLGILPKQLEEAAKTLERLGVKLSGIASHFAESEDLESEFTDNQTAVFEGALEKFSLRKLLHTDARIHLSNSGGILRGKGSFATAVRPGISLFGISPNDRIEHSKDLLPVLEWKTRVLCLKDVGRGETVGYGRTYTAGRKEKIAILPVGYADGYPRSLSGKSFVILNGKRSMVRGRVSMDLIAVDVTGQVGIREGQVATLIGGHGKLALGASFLGRLAGSFAYEILCGISDRVPRVYLE